MIYQFLKYVLGILFILALNCLVILFLDKSSPDNFLYISSQSHDFSYITYYVFSLLTGLDYITGAWVILAFILYSFNYIFFLNPYKEFENVFSALFIFSASGVVLFSLFLCLSFFPQLIGAGLSYLCLVSLGLNSTVAVILTVFFAFVTIACNFSILSKKDTNSSLLFIKNYFGKMRQKINSSLLALGAFPREFLMKVQSKLPLFKKGVQDKVFGTQRDEPSNNSTEEGLVEQHSWGNDKDKDNDKDDELDSSDFDSEPEASSKPSLKAPAGTSQKNQKTQKIADKKSSVQANDAKYFQAVASVGSVKSGQGRGSQPKNSYFDDIISRIEEKLGEFKIDGKIINVLKGPVVDTFELELGAGVKVSKVTSASEDLSLALYGAPIRVVYPMRGRTTIGIEVPRNPREIIYLDEVFSSKEFKSSKQILPVAMGKDAFGEAFVVDLASMPHMLIAGATGAGKSVFINTLLVSLLVKKTPSQMKLILIDPKQLELALYAKLPHLVVPVITDSKTASFSLLWATQEMERRYSILKEFGVRNIEGFNQKLKKSSSEYKQKIEKYYTGDDESLELPYLVIIVDEFADLILTKAGKEIENNICRLAAKARAAGIHLVLATQRPSVDVITGLIKSNFPTRVSFRVTTSVDSRTILNAMGAEKLLGKGDMLYKHGVETIRMHSSYVDEDDIEVLTDKLAAIEPEFNSEAIEFIESEGLEDPDPYSFGSNVSSASNGKDDLYGQAVQVVMEHRSASASMLQRRLRIGYNRAANLIEELEQKGVVGPAQGSKPREILSSPE